MHVSAPDIDGKVLLPEMVAASKPLRSRKFSARHLRSSRGVYNWRRVSHDVILCMFALVQYTSVMADLPLLHKSSVAVKRELKQILAYSLQSNAMEKAFAKDCGFSGVPRADDPEALMNSFPRRDAVNWDAKPVCSGINVATWKVCHARHCEKCTAAHIHDDCYFKLLHHFLQSGFDPPERHGVDMGSNMPSVRAYVDKWMSEQKRCDRAFTKWTDEAKDLMSPVTDSVPRSYSPLLPVTRAKDVWKRDRFGTEYKIRLCLDLKRDGVNDDLAEWPFRYWGLECVAECVRKGDWLGTLDISRFYLRLPAGERLRAVQWFQDPSSFAADTNGNERMAASRLRFRQLLSVAFGLKSAPAYASAVSAEAVRILRSFGVDVAGVYLDDLLIRGATKEECAKNMELAKSVLKALDGHSNKREGTRTLFARGRNCVFGSPHSHRCLRDVCFGGTAVVHVGQGVGVAGSKVDLIGRS